ncbi:TWiK family of potassium channels protein 18-like [Leptidea sinapis]|uniref:TWiK family of potassium channels protein 18-like n=1 Tax=Leptidea sinapis TaxID=189913 RepID=UPI002135ED94|nr:TWiK family of potassium channels protein 18-like [Leptidea sinapis]XP_050677312.1 TWiK family of potassium channels protein 18-like [Leptidea sinapis]XP_050677313.1 TWiK family of potassium channels protein 18-like [Leptidea sinapis]XP_050677314.1 TWiK family of potassium channels protein 18-like [Leptidea sinapis]
MMVKDGSRDTKRAYQNALNLSNLGLEDTKLYCCRCSQKRRASPLTCLSICFLVLTYNLFGGFLFFSLEGNTASETAVAESKPNLSRSSGELRLKTVEKLWSITEDLNILYKENWTQLAAKELMDFQKVLLKSLRNNEEEGHNMSYEEMEYRWSFAGSFLYALTLITTIGHGNVAPKSTIGKMTAVLYSCVGIPLIMLYLSTLGEAFARSFRSFYSKICPKRFRRQDFHTKAECIGNFSSNKEISINRQTRTPFQAALNLENLNGGYHWTCQDHTRVPIILSLSLMILYIVLGTFVFHATENWNLLDGCYFSFSSLATIGFGNLKPGLYASTVSAKTEDIAIGVCCIYILVGIVFIAMCFNLIQEDLAIALRNLTALCGGSSKSRAIHSIDPADAKITMSVAS